MISLKQILTGSAVAALVGVGVMASTGSASAYVVCNNAGDCWHTDTRYKYNRDVGATYHNDNWYFHQKWDGGDRHYRDYHEGRGGYRNGIWFSF